MVVRCLVDALYFASFHALGAYFCFFDFAVDACSYALHVGQKLTRGYAMRVADVAPKAGLLATYGAYF